MKFLHTGDLHIGKTVNGFSLLKDQKYVLRQIEEAAVREKAEAVVIAGDVYDRAIPPAEAVTVLNDFLSKLVRDGIQVLLISGNHDSPERLGFAEDILKERGVHIAGIYKERLKRVTFTDAYGEAAFLLLPFLKPASAGAGTSREAVEKILRTEGILPDKEKEETEENGRKIQRQVLVTHFFVTDGGKEPELCEGETTVHVGGLDNVEAALFADFDYTALGHIHKSQKIGGGQVYYAGAPLAYSFSEAGQTKSMNLVELREKGEVVVKQLPFRPLHEMRKIRGRIEELTAAEVVAAADPLDYIQARLTNEEELIDPIGVLRSVYPNVMQILLEKNERTAAGEYAGRTQEREKSIPELFEDFYETVRGSKPDERQKSVIEQVAKEAGGMEK